MRMTTFLQLVQLCLYSSDGLKRKKSVAIPGLLLLCMELRHFQEHHLRLPSSSCLSSSHAFSTFYPPEQTRSRSRCTTVSSGASTRSRRFQQGVFAVLSFLRQSSGVMASCTNAIALLKVLGENRGLERGILLFSSIFPSASWDKMKCDTAMSVSCI